MTETAPNPLLQKDPAARAEQGPPARRVARAYEVQARGSQPLGDAFTGADTHHFSELSVDLGYVEHRFKRDTLKVTIDVRAFDFDVPDSEELRLGALAVLYELLVRDVFGQVAHSAEVDIVRYVNVDEYGEGALSSADRLWSERLTHDELVDLLRR